MTAAISSAALFLANGHVPGASPRNSYSTFAAPVRSHVDFVTNSAGMAPQARVAGDRSGGDPMRLRSTNYRADSSVRVSQVVPPNFPRGIRSVAHGGFPHLSQIFHDSVNDGGNRHDPFVSGCTVSHAQQHGEAAWKLLRGSPTETFAENGGGT